MNRRIALRAAAVATLALVPFVALTTTPAAADAPSAVGYWSKTQVTAGPLGTVVPAPPPNVPEGGLYVAQDPSGPAAVSTLRYSFPEPTGGTLTLATAAGSTFQTATINACPVASPWEPVANGDIAAAPEEACDLFSVNGSFNDDGSALTFVIPESFPVNDGSVEIYLVASSDSMPFTVSFQPPGEDSFVTSGSSGFDSEFDFDGGDFGGDDFGGGSGGSGSGDFGGGAAGSSGPGASGSGFSAPSSPSGGGSSSAPSTGGGDFSAPATEAPAAAGGPGAGGSGSGGGDTAAAPELAGNQGDPIDDGTARTFAIGALLAIGAGLFWLSSRTGGAPAALGALAGSRAATTGTGATAGALPDPGRGVGRFARPRVRPPVPL